MAEVREFESGATKSKDDNKPDYEGFLSPLVIEAFGEYMHKHRTQVDGSLRDSDNWQKGIPYSALIKSMWRHFMDLWKLYREHEVKDRDDGHSVDIKEACCAIMFNVMCYLHEHLTSISNSTWVNHVSYPIVIDEEELKKVKQYLSDRRIQ